MRPFEPWMLGIIDEAGYNGLTDEHIQRVADEILKMGITNVSRADFERACQAGIRRAGEFRRRRHCKARGAFEQIACG